MLHVEVVDDIGLPEGGIGLSLFQREPNGMETDEAVAQRPLLDGALQDDVFGEDDRVDVLELLHPGEYLPHGFGVGFLGHGADADDDLLLPVVVTCRRALAPKGRDVNFGGGRGVHPKHWGEGWGVWGEGREGTTVRGEQVGMALERGWLRKKLWGFHQFRRFGLQKSKKKKSELQHNHSTNYF